jgi:hypothetical protein
MAGRATAVRGFALAESASFMIKSSFFLGAWALALYLLLGATYPPVHDTLHDFRHALAIVPCH